jgi:uncharacterized membrane protein HdeD (DUF308 family)
MKNWLQNTDVKNQLATNIKLHKNMYVLNGIMFIVLGTMACAAPLFAAEVLNMMIGLLLLLTGLFQLGVNYKTSRHSAYYVSALISVIAGAILIVYPYAGVVVLTIIIALFMLLQGCMQLFYASIYAPYPGWGWMLATGVFSIALAAIVYAGWPVIAMWFLGVIVGVNLISIGIGMIMLANIMNGF